MMKQEQFINQIKNIKNYWLRQPNLTIEETVDGVLFSLLVMVDGESSANDFRALEIIDTEDDESISCGYLHEYYHD